MVLSMIEQFLVVAFAGLLLWSAVSDARNLVIPNRISIAIGGLWLAHATALLAAGAPVGPLLMAVAIASGAFAVGTLLFAMRFIGGGDVKLFAAVMLWAGSDFAFPFVVMMLLAGGVLALSVLLVRVGRSVLVGAGSEGARLPLSVAFVNALRSTVPFGMAISFSGLFVAYRLFFGAPAL